MVSMISPFHDVLNGWKFVVGEEHQVDRPGDVARGGCDTTFEHSSKPRLTIGHGGQPQSVVHK